MELMDLLKVYGPMSLGWILAGYMLKFVLDRYAADIEARIHLATALNKLTDRIDAKL